MLSYPERFPSSPQGESLAFHIGPGKILKQHYLCKIMKLGTWVPRKEPTVVRREGAQLFSVGRYALLMAKFLNSHTNQAAGLLGSCLSQLSLGLLLRL